MSCGNWRFSLVVVWKKNVPSGFSCDVFFVFCDVCCFLIHDFLKGRVVKKMQFAISVGLPLGAMLS